jgi:hypothetical protein
MSRLRRFVDGVFEVLADCLGDLLEAVFSALLP